MQSVLVRMPDELKTAIEKRAGARRMSLVEFVTETLERAVESELQEIEGDEGPFVVEKTIAFLTTHAVSGTVATYAEVAAANGRSDWATVRYAMGRHLTAVGLECLARELPWLTSIVVRKSDGEPGDGFFRLTDKMGFRPADRRRFVEQRQKEVWAWGQKIQNSAAEEQIEPYAGLRGVWKGPSADELLAWTRGEPDETGSAQ